jgi:hypothetical protein
MSPRATLRVDEDVTARRSLVHIDDAGRRTCRFCLRASHLRWRQWLRRLQSKLRRPCSGPMAHRSRRTRGRPARGLLSAFFLCSASLAGWHEGRRLWGPTGSQERACLGHQRAYRQVTPAHGREGGQAYPQWAPNGRWIAYERFPNTTPEPTVLMVMRPDGSHKHEVARGKRGLQIGSWSPGSLRIVFSKTTAEGMAIVVARADGGGPLSSWVPARTACCPRCGRRGAGGSCTRCSRALGQSPGSSRSGPTGPGFGSWPAGRQRTRIPHGHPGGDGSPSSGARIRGPGCLSVRSTS